MAKAAKRVTADPRQGIAEITVAGFKSISDEHGIEIRPLTVLAGANSSGKSSMMQPLLLLKQTLQASYDPGPLLLNGPNVKFTSADQLLARTGKGRSTDVFQVAVRLHSGRSFQASYRKEHRTGFHIEQMTVSDKARPITVWPQMTPDEIVDSGATRDKDLSNEEFSDAFGKPRWEIMRDRCFLEVAWVAHSTDGGASVFVSNPIGGDFAHLIADMIHLPGLRGSPEQTYPAAAVGNTFPGTFDKYTASVISNWESEKDVQRLDKLNDSLRLLALTGGVTTLRPNDVQIELYVGRLPDVLPKRPEDRVNVAHVGIGVSQALPVVTALLVARPGQLVYLEQPEIHLHPRAQVALAQMLADAAKRGVRVVAETHSNLLLLGIQSLVAEGKLTPDLVKLHWFSRNKSSGVTTVTSADMDEVGRFPDWPEDFDDVTLQAQKHYLDSASRRMFAG